MTHPIHTVLNQVSHTENILKIFARQDIYSTTAFLATWFAKYNTLLFAPNNFE